ncbi:MAG: peptidase associated/transthyretin-like domain-containing protein [Ignavibacteriaceae bacterium]
MSLAKKIIPAVVFVLLFITSILNFSCKPNSTITQPTGSGTNQTSIISGQVISSTTGIPVDSAIVQVYGSSVNTSIFTDSQGKFSTSIQVPSSITLTLFITKSGFNQDTVAITVTGGTNYAFQSPISLTPASSGQIPSGDPVSIFLASQSSTSIGIIGSGSPVTATLTFEAVDSSGTPIDLNHSVMVNFSIGAQPGGASPSPVSVQSNDLGQASVNITSGTKAGVVQVYASINLGTHTIYSQPVALTIFGGLPDLAHFSIIPALFNFPGYDIFNLTDAITAIVGDKYSNPVRPGTAVYFQSTAGVIGASTNTDASGIGSVILRSAAPLANNTQYGTGFAMVTAYTADENKDMIYDSVKILFSGIAQNPIVSPTTFDIPNGGFQNFTYTVSDENGNPLAKGTTISVAVSGTNVAGQGDVAVALPDTQSKTWTHFGFQVYDTNDTVNVSAPVSVIISTNGPNGSSSTTIYGTSH